MAVPLNGNGGNGKDHDVTGRDRMTWNILSSWGGHMVFVIAGFIMPRMIDRHIGQISLGIWDFSWSLVSYFGLAGLGIGSSVNRYVAKLRAAEDKNGLDEAVSSVVCIQGIVSVVIALLTAAAVWFLPRFFKMQHAVELSDAQWVVAFLGASLVVQQIFDSNRGVMTGCHRWDLHNGINSGSYAITVVIMVVSLSLGHGLQSLAAIYFAVGFVTEIYRHVVVRKICPDLEIGIRKATWSQSKKMLSFGVKTIVVGLPVLIIIQGVNLLVARHLGPAMLAVFSRPIGLIRNTQTFINKYALVLTPTAGSLQGSGKEGEIRELMIRTTRYSVAMTLPIVLFLAIMGGPILEVWMGPRYEAGTIMAILALGCFFPMTQQSAMTILVGLNAHGTIGAVNLALSVATIVVGSVALDALGWSLIGAAVLVGIFKTAVGAVVFFFACRSIRISVGRYLRKSFLGPVAAGVPFAITLVVARMAFAGRPFLALAAGCVAGGIVMAPIYWKYFLPQELRNRIRRHFGPAELEKPAETE